MIELTHQWLCTKEVAAYTGYSPSFFEKLRCYGGGPAFYKVRGRVRYKLSDVDEWLEAMRCEAGTLTLPSRTDGRR